MLTFNLNIQLAIKKGAIAPFFNIRKNYLFITYIVTSKPKRISVAAGLVHIMFLLNYFID